jgi:eukaryotic-like serine/threonine-protein kinase
MNLDIGAVLGDYEITGILGAGGMGKVFKVRNTISDRTEAMKVLLPDLAGEADLADRFLREIKVQASLDHPNIAGLRTAFRFENQLLMIMELVEGITLDQRLQQGPLPVPEAVSCISQVLAALSYAHRSGVVHRDIKPANMMLTANGVVKLLDFGIAKGSTDRKLTMTGTTMGSLYYMSPEQIRGSQTLDARSDLYSVGVSLYELVTGKRPFDGDSQFAIMSAHLEKSPVPPIVVDPRLPQVLNDLILTSVEREPERRFQSAEAFRNALGNVAGQPDAATIPLNSGPAKQRPAPPPVAVPAAAAKSNRTLWMTVGGVCAAGVVVGLIQFGPWRQTAASNPPPTATAPVSAPATTQPAPVDPTPPVSTPQSVAPKSAVTPEKPAPRQEPKQTARVAQAPASSTPAVSTPTQAPVQPPPQPASVPPQQAVQAQPDAAARAELQKIRESLVGVSARAGTIRSTLQRLERSQAASGLGLRSDWVQTALLMDSFLQGANNALNAGDVASARDLMDKAERQVERMEKALNK